MKYVLVLVIVFVVAWLMMGRSRGRGRDPKADDAGRHAGPGAARGAEGTGKAAAADTQTMVGCTHTACTCPAARPWPMRRGACTVAMCTAWQARAEPQPVSAWIPLAWLRRSQRQTPIAAPAIVAESNGADPRAAAAATPSSTPPATKADWVAIRSSMRAGSPPATRCVLRRRLRVRSGRVRRCRTARWRGSTAPMRQHAPPSAWAWWSCKGCRA